jgi:hypothetical protein
MEAEHKTDNLPGMAAKPEVMIAEHEPDVSSSEENQTPDPSKLIISLETVNKLL